jgi:hypothetical protein
LRRAVPMWLGTVLDSGMSKLRNVLHVGKEYLGPKYNDQNQYTIAQDSKQLSLTQKVNDKQINSSVGRQSHTT